MLFNYSSGIVRRTSLLLSVLSLALLSSCVTKPAQIPAPPVPTPPQAITVQPATYREIEFEDGQLRVISSQNTTYHRAVADQQMVPRGSALYTPSGALAQSGIQGIIHAAS